jgi:hypothetical protein
VPDDEWRTMFLKIVTVALLPLLTAGIIGMFWGLYLIKKK